MNLRSAVEGLEYVVKEIDTDDEELNSFLFSLGCYAGEPVTVIKHMKGGCVVSIKDGRYNIDKQLAEAIVIDGEAAPNPEVKAAATASNDESEQSGKKKRLRFGWFRH